MKFIEAKNNPISKAIASLSDEDICILFKEIFDYRHKGTLINDSNLRRIAMEIHEKLQLPNDIRMVEDVVLLEAARRFYNLRNNN